MTSDPAEPMSPETEAREASHLARRRWADEVQRAMAERHLSINAAAKAIGISTGRLQAWLKQDVEPSPSIMRDLARLIGREHAYLLQLLDWLPADMSDAPLRLQATASLGEAIAEAQRWLHTANLAMGLAGGNVLAGKLLETSHRWYVTLRSNWRGRRYPVRYDLHVGVADAHAPTTGSDLPAASRTAADRSEIEGLIHEAMVSISARWLSSEEFTDQAWAPRPDLVLAAPLLCASRPRGLQPNLFAPPSIVVIGGSLTGGQEVGALVADSLGWSYLNVTSTAVERFDLPETASPLLVAQAEAMIARRLIQEPTRLGRHTVWSYGNPRAVLQTIRGIGPELPLVVLLRAPDSLLAYLGTPGSDGDESPEDLIDTAQSVVRRTLANTRSDRDYLILDVPDLPLHGRMPEAGNVIFDMHVELAFQVARWLQEQHNGPDLLRTESILGELQRAAR